jgi:hypothetical protein
VVGVGLEEASVHLVVGVLPAAYLGLYLVVVPVVFVPFGLFAAKPLVYYR